MAPCVVEAQYIFIALVVVVAFELAGSQQQSQNSADVLWYGLAPNSCHGRTCRIDQYCSDAPAFQGCRPCSNLLVWCDKNMSQIRQKFPSCEAHCERVLSEKQIELLRNETQRLLEENVRLEKERIKCNNSTLLEMGILKETTQTEGILYTVIGVLSFIILVLIIVCSIKRYRRRTGQRCVQNKTEDPESTKLLTVQSINMSAQIFKPPGTELLHPAQLVEEGYETGSYSSSINSAPSLSDLPHPTEACNEPITMVSREESGQNKELAL